MLMSRGLIGERPTRAILSLGGLMKRLSWSTADIFADGRRGGEFDPSDLSTLYQDTLGTPVTSHLDPVGMVLDKSRGLTFGPDLVVNGGFATDTDWTKQAGWTIGTGTANYSNTVAGSLRQPKTLTSGNTYLIEFDVTRVAAGSVTPRLFGTTVVSGVAVNTVGRHSQYLRATGNTDIDFLASAGADLSIDNVTVKHLPGLHWLQQTAASRLVYQKVGALHRLAFDGVDDFFQMGTFALPPRHYQALAYDTNGGTDGLLWNADVANPWMNVFQSGSTNTTLSSAGTFNDLRVDGMARTAKSRGGIFNAVNGRHVSIWDNSTNQGSAAWRIGNYPPNSIVNLKGYLYGMVWAEYLSDDEQAKLARYLAQKSGLAA